jgi:hypothetical protein
MMSGGDYEEYRHLGYKTLIRIFTGNTSPLQSPAG